MIEEGSGNKYRKVPDLHKRGNKIGAIKGEQKEQIEFRYNTAIGSTEYTVLIREEETAIKTVLEKLKKIILRDSLEGCYSKGEEAI